MMRWPVLATLSLCALTTLASGVPSSERRTELNYLLLQDCGSCHGLTMKGGLGPALTPESLAGKPAIYLQTTILHGRPGTAMPPWHGILTEAESLWLAERLLAGEAGQ